MAVPKNWRVLEVVELNQAQIQVSDAAAIDHAWWRQFNDPVLEKLINKARIQNLDIKQAITRVAAARALYGGSAAGLVPAINGVGGAKRARNNYPGMAPGKPYNSFNAGFDASWELDLWGGKRRAREAAKAQLEAATDDANAATVHYLAEVARIYMDIRYYQRHIRLNHDNTTSQRQTLKLAENQWKAGQSDQFDVLRAESQLTALEARLPQLEIGLHATIAQLAVLLGEAPKEVEAELYAELTVSLPAMQMALQAPAAVLAARPDIKAAERRLAAATAAQGIATADMFPKISLGGFFGVQQITGSKLFSSNSDSWSAGANVSVPLLDFGLVRSRVKVAEAQAEQALYAYQKTVLSAVAEVETALISYLNEDKRRAHLSQFVATNTKAAEIAKSRYKEGLSSFLDVLDVERTLFDSQALLAESEASVGKNLVALYKALGGGWQVVGQ